MLCRQCGGVPNFIKLLSLHLYILSLPTVFAVLYLRILLPPGTDELVVTSQALFCDPP